MSTGHVGSRVRPSRVGVDTIRTWRKEGRWLWPLALLVALQLVVEALILFDDDSLWRQRTRVDQAPASIWVGEQLARPMDNDVLTIVWQSITAQYWPASEREAVITAIAEARRRMPLAHVSMEGIPPPRSDGYATERHGPRD